MMIALVLMAIVFAAALAIVIALWSETRRTMRSRRNLAQCDACRNMFDLNHGYSSVSLDLTLPEGEDFVLLPINLLICGVCLHAQAVNS